VCAYWEYQWDAATDGLASVEDGLVAQKHVLAAVGILPADDRGTVEQDLDSVARGQGSNHSRSVVRDTDERSWSGRGDGDGGWLGGAFDHVCGDGSVVIDCRMIEQVKGLVVKPLGARYEGQ
jgi:hypothetical protein